MPRVHGQIYRIDASKMAKDGGAIMSEETVERGNAMTDKTRLSERERKVLIGITENSAPDWAFPFQSIIDLTGIEPHNTRRVVRSLARKGMMRFCRGLISDDGELAGSGYAVTEAGWEWAQQQAQPK